MLRRRTKHSCYIYKIVTLTYFIYCGVRNTKVDILSRRELLQLRQVPDSLPSPFRDTSAVKIKIKIYYYWAPLLLFHNKLKLVQKITLVMRPQQRPEHKTAHRPRPRITEQAKCSGVSQSISSN